MGALPIMATKKLSSNRPEKVSAIGGPFDGKLLPKRGKIIDLPLILGQSPSTTTHHDDDESRERKPVASFHRYYLLTHQTLGVHYFHQSLTDGKIFFTERPSNDHDIGGDDTSGD
jgi:hypothetical protein